jgi:very-short-patch-repair endonuclease
MVEKRVKGRGDSRPSRRGEVLVAILNSQADFAILRDQGWYRIPVASAPKRWPPAWLAFYQTKIFDAEAYAVKYYGRVRTIETVARRDLFSNEPQNPKSDRLYYQVHLDSLQELAHPILSRRWRRIVFIPTTWTKFANAAEINDLFDESPLEDALWGQLQRFQIQAERQWLEQVGQHYFLLDFAIFCNAGNVDVETDGDTYHVGVRPAAQDNRRNNELTAAGWHVLRFNGQQIRETAADYCIAEITKTIKRLDGLRDEGIAPRRFFQTSAGTGSQLSLFDPGEESELD